MASAYAAFADRGTYCTPVAIESITQTVANQKKSLPSRRRHARGDVRDHRRHDQHPPQGVVEDGTGTPAGLGSRPSAGKTGTTDNRYAAWFVGYTPNMAGAVWVGDPAHKRQMKSIRIGGVWNDKSTVARSRARSGAT